MKKNEVEIGMKVQISKKPRIYPDGPYFVDGMHEYRGKKTKITGIHNANRVKLAIDKESWMWDPRWLSVVKKTTVKKSRKKVK